MLCKTKFEKVPQKSLQNFCEWLLLVLVRIHLVWPAANLFMFCRIDCKSVFKVFSLSTEIQSSTDLAQMNTQSITKVDGSTQMITEVDLTIEAAARVNPGT